MQRTTPNPRASEQLPGPAGDGLRVAPVRRARSLPWAVTGVLLVTGCSLLFILASFRLGGRAAVLAVARPVAAGQALSAADLTVARVAADPDLRAVPAAEREGVLGRTAAVPLVPGTLLSRAHLGPPAVPARGEALVGMALEPGRFPPGLAPGARVLVTVTAPPAAGGTPAAVPAAGEATLVPSAVVTAVERPAAGGRDPVTVALVVPEASAARVAAAAAAGQVALVQLPPGSGP